MIERLVVLQMVAGAVAGGAADRVRARFEVAAALPPRLLVVRLAADDLAALQGIGGIAVVAADPVGLKVTPALNEAERLFAAGWAARGLKSGPRAGDGLAWDTPGFEPPDGSNR